MIINNSRATTYEKCPRKYFWTYEYNSTGLVLTQVDKNLAWGTIVHHLLAQFYAERPWRDTLQDALRAGVPNFDSIPWLDQEAWRERLNWASEVMTHYERFAQKHDNFTVLDLESEGSMPLSSRHSLVYRADMVVNRNGRVSVWDHKTTSSLGSVYLESWQYSPQMLLYTKAVRQHHPEANFYELNFIKKSQNEKILKRCPDCYAGKHKVLTCTTCNHTGKVERTQEEMFVRELPIAYIERRAQHAVESRNQICNDIEADRSALRAGARAFEMRPSQCFSMGKCPFVDLCWHGNGLSPTEDLLQKYLPRPADYVTLAREEME